MLKLDAIQKRLIEEIADLHSVPEGAYNFRANSELAGRNTTANIIKNSIDILQDIRKVCFEGSKMTEQERHKIMRGIRPKMRKFNKRLETLALALRYSTLLDLWNQIDERARFLDAKTRRDIIERCRLQWKNNAKSVSIKEG